MKKSTENSEAARWTDAVIAELPDTCMKKLREFERELNKQGYWNIALVAYQLKS